ncbi:3-hydroxybutyryl-CoA dehydrogenase [Rhodoplanes sp. TEM]|uniref:3-hydroxybutyryl-CoA dehydrogenase n=1 Tax=Rhodoplanes tepidamans TaxID=200616 RepID=A0ABT5JGT3_RHOTP|nr:MULTISPECIES: 3-hydroxybutyryl-CoA dehydrogenase [Rhodoplanes]MDC7788571.1 3-hydroxybutyryl-CoA dehydrogenase [Rhodoplanes tepidamans]MDC7986789.1 3-hydroxybutyryl-CoA dehydrogenase [Rhodoplanes sp. TEM]
MVRRIGVVGAGTMGNGIAQLFAAAGHPVTMCDLKPEFLDRAMATIARNLDRQVARRTLDVADRDAALARIGPTTAMADLADCDVVIEAVLEDFTTKGAVIRQLDAICRRDAILATNTSSISVTQLAAVSTAPERVVGMHFFNPVPMMELVEIIRGLQTGDAACDTVVALTRAVGKTPKLARDSFGFVVNRVLVPMINEAINCVYEGIASAEDVDAMMKLGANHPMGPLALADLIGLDIVLDIMETLSHGFEDPKYRPSPLLKQMCDAGYLGRKSGRGFFTYAPSR